MQFVCLCYYNQAQYDACSPADLAQVGRICAPRDAELRATGRVIINSSLGQPGSARTPVVELNRAAAVAMRDAAAGLALVDAILARGDLGDYSLAHATRADLCRLGRNAEARDAYRRALELTQQEPERRFLERRLRELAT